MDDNIKWFLTHNFTGEEGSDSHYQINMMDFVQECTKVNVFTYTVNRIQRYWQENGGAEGIEGDFDGAKLDIANYKSFYIMAYEDDHPLLDTKYGWDADVTLQMKTKVH